MTKNNKDLASQLEKLTQKAVNDDPHSEKNKTANKKANTKLSKSRKPTARKPQTSMRRRIGVSFTPGAEDALRELEVFLMMECGADGMSSSGAISIALEFTAAKMGANKENLQKLLEIQAEKDGRRRAD